MQTHARPHATLYAREAFLTLPCASSQLLSHSDDLFIIGLANTCEYESASVPKQLGYSFMGPLKLAPFHPDDRQNQLAGAQLERRGDTRGFRPPAR